MTTLTDLIVGEDAVITTLTGERLQRMKLLDLGLTPHTRVTVCKIAPMGDPIEVAVRSYVLTLRKAEASLIEVQKGPAPTAPATAAPAPAAPAPAASPEAAPAPAAPVSTAPAASPEAGPAPAAPAPTAAAPVIAAASTAPAPAATPSSEVAR